MEEKIRNWDKHLENKLERLAKSNLSPGNKRVIKAFGDDCFLHGLGNARIYKYTHYLMRLATWLEKDFQDCTKDDLKQLVIKIEKTQYVTFSKKEYKICLRKLFRWLRNTDEDYPPEVKWIKPSNGKSEKTKLPEEMLNEDDIKRLINAASNSLDKTLISMLYETGCRISELLFMKIKNIEFDEHGAVIIVPSMKTGSRRIRIVSSVPFLNDWLNMHPLKDTPSAYLWPSNKNEVMGYTRTITMLKKLAKKAGIKKKVNPHNFRHSRATYLANFLTEAQMKEYFGWIQASDMAAIYVHLSGRDVDNAILKVYGRNKSETPEESILTPKTCSRCKQENPSSNKFCSRCGMPMDTQTMNQVIKSELDRKNADSFLDRLLNDPKFRALFDEKLKEISPSAP